MKLNTLQRSILISLLYIGIFAGLVFLQFSNRDRFQENSGAIGISGSRGDSSGGAFPAELTVSFKGLGFVFGSGRPVAVADSSGARSVILPRSYSRDARSVSVTLERGVRIDFSASASGDSFSVSASLPDGGPAAIEFPYTLSSASLREAKEGLSVRSRGVQYDLGLSGGARLDTDAHVLSLKGPEGRISLDARKAPVKIAAAPDSQAPRPMDPKAFKALSDAYVEKCWRGLKDARYDPVQEAWSYGGEYRFTEEALVALIAEAYRRGQYGEISSMANALAKDKSDKLSWKSDVYFGGIVRKAEGLAAGDSAEYARLSKLLAAKDPSIFESPRLVSFIVDRCPADFAPKVYAFAAALDPGSLTVRQAAGMAACLAEAEGFLPGANNPFLRFEPLIEKKILPAMSKAREGSLLATDPSAVDLSAQARTGAALVAWGGLRYSEVSTGMGEALLQGLYSLADDSGMLPASLSLKEGEIVGKQGNLAPETIYPYVADNPWYPREVSFSKQAGPGTWAWTCSPDLRWEGNAAQASISASWPQGMAHFLTVFGIAPFSQIQIYDIPYSPDSEFESYNVSGYSYSRSSRTLFLKMKHKSEKEYVRLTFQ